MEKIIEDHCSTTTTTTTNGTPHQLVCHPNEVVEPPEINGATTTV